MKKSKTFLLLLMLLICLNSFSASSDSLLFIEKTKAFLYQEIGFVLIGDFYTKWETEEKPYVYVYVSLPDKVERPKKFKDPYFAYGTDEASAILKESELKLKGYSTFLYKTYANSWALLNNIFLSYSRDAKAFILFHEIMHNYFKQKHIKIPYEFIEPTCDLIGNYGTLTYAQSTQNVDFISAEEQIRNNERIYECFNLTISEINKNPLKTLASNSTCNDTISMILRKSNSFQKFRFDYKVNNAYLIKNGYYCKNYFLLKAVYLKQKSIKSFLEIIEKMPKKSSACLEYLEKFV
jgi:hypothetical protein